MALRSRPAVEASRLGVVSEEVFPHTTHAPLPPAHPPLSHLSHRHQWVAQRSTWAVAWPTDARDRITNWHTCVRRHPRGGHTTTPLTTLPRAMRFPQTTPTLALQ